MALYANTTAEIDGKRYERGAKLPDDFDGRDEFVKYGSAVEEKPEPLDTTPPEPIDHVRALRDRYAASEMTLEEFEAELDRLLNVQPVTLSDGAEATDGAS